MSIAQTTFRGPRATLETLAFWRPLPVFVPTASQVVLAAIAAVATHILMEAIVAHPIVGLRQHGLIWLGAVWFFLLLPLSIGPLLVGRAKVVPTLIFVAMWLSVITNLFTIVLTFFPENLALSLGWLGIIFVLTFTAIFRLLGALRAWPTVLIYTGVSLWMLASEHYTPLFYSEEAAFTQTETEDVQTDVDVEELYTNQARLLAKQLREMSAGQAGVPEAFALVLGGTAHESVFLNEVESVSAILSDRYGASGRTIRLANSEDHPFRYPMANRANLKAALDTLAERMNPGEDLAFLYLTSHGSRDRFALSFWQAGTHSLSASEFATMLDESGLSNAVIVISACYAGSFIDDIAAADRIVITASAADRTSFGCADGRDWTYWGEAFFSIALGETADPRAAYTRAAEVVAEWEQRDGLTPSLPQMSVGPALDAFLNDWLGALDTRDTAENL